MNDNAISRRLGRDGVRMRARPSLVTASLAFALSACGASGGLAATTTNAVSVGPAVPAENSTAETHATTTESPVITTTSVPLVEVTVIGGLAYREAVLEDSSTTRSVVDVYVPEGSDPRPAVVLLHGYTQFESNTELTPLTTLAREIARLGATVFYFKWHTVRGWSATSGDDLACIGSFVASRAGEFGASSDRVVIVGHSIGAEAGANLAFRSFDLPTSGDCTEDGQPPTASAFLGIGGTYGWVSTPVDSSPDSFVVIGGCDEEPRQVGASELIAPGLTAREGSELGSYGGVELAPDDLRVVLLVGSLDPKRCAAPNITRSFAETLDAAGIDTEVIEVDGAGHEDVVLPPSDPGKRTLTVIESILDDLEGS